MKTTPPGWPRISVSLFYEDAPAAIDWLCKTYGFELRLKIEGEGGRIEHSELEIGGGDGLIYVSQTGGKSTRPNPLPGKSPRAVGGTNTQMLCVIVDDVEAHFKHAKAAGAKIIDEPVTNDYGEDYWADRTYRTEDLEGHHWWFMQRVRDQKPKKS